MGGEEAVMWGGALNIMNDLIRKTMQGERGDNRRPILAAGRQRQLGCRSMSTAEILCI